MRGPRLFLSAATALALVGAALVPATAAAPPAPIVGVEVAPAGAAQVASATIGADAVYAVTYSEYTGTRVLGDITSRSLERNAGTTAVGFRSFVGRTSAPGIAEHEGVVAYVRASDGRLVLQAPDGTETAPAWGKDASFADVGPQGMNDHWVASSDELFQRTTGQRIDLVEASKSVLGPPYEGIVPIAVVLSEGRVAWSVVEVRYNALINQWTFAFHVMTAPLTVSGIGAVWGVGYSNGPAVVAGMSDDHLVWLDAAEQGDGLAGTAHVVDLATYDEVATHPVPDLEGSEVRTDVVVTRDELVLGTVLLDGSAPTVVRRHTLGPVTETYTSYLENGSVVLDADAGLVASVDMTGAVDLVDVAGGEVVLTQPPVPAGPFVTQTPARLLFDKAVTPGAPRCVKLTGDEAGVNVPEGATGAIVNVAAVRPNDVGYVVVYPDTLGTGSTPIPEKGSTVNFEPGRDVGNATFVALPPNGRICYATRGASSTGVVVDVSGYTLEGSGVVMRPTTRALDTRKKDAPVPGPVVARTVHTFDIATEAALPDTAAAVIVNVAVTGANAPGHLRLFPGGTALPGTATLNYAPGVDKANGAVVPLSADGTISLYSDTAPSSPVNVVIDVVGYVEDGGAISGVLPKRLLDTRPTSRVGTIAGPVAPRTVVSLDVAGDPAVPDDATAVVLNVTAVQPTANGHLRVYPDVAGTRRTLPPDTATLNYLPGRDIPNLVVVAVPEDGRINFWSDQFSGQVELVVDLIGYVAP